VASYTVTGLEGLKRKLKKIENIREVLDAVYARAARDATRKFITETPKMTGQTARGWMLPVKRGLSDYLLKNKTTTTDKKHSLIEILDKGRRTVYPVVAKSLYIPLSNKGRSKRAGAPIPAGFVYGKDYVFAKKSKATKGKFFINKINKETSTYIKMASLEAIAKS
jgi:hypothetical protein